MRALIQRVAQASVTVDDRVVGRIDKGFLVLLGVGTEDTPADADALAAKMAKLRVFEDDEGRMNLALGDVGGGVLVVSQFTLMADTRKGNRPSFIRAARPEQAEPLYARFCETLRAMELPVEEGVFGAHMDVRLLNDGPVTLLLET